MTNSSTATIGDTVDDLYLELHFTAVFFRYIVQCLSHDVSVLCEAVVKSVSWISDDVYSIFSEELAGLQQDLLELRTESLRKKKRHDILRSALSRVYSDTVLVAATALEYAAPFSRYHTSFIKYVSGTRSYLEMENVNDVPVLHELRCNFCDFIFGMCKKFKDPLYVLLFNDEVRFDLFSLFTKWCGGFFCHTKPLAPVFGTIPWYETSLGLKAFQAASSLCRGPVFDTSAAINKDGYICTWVHNAFEIKIEAIRQLTMEALKTVLIDNSHEKGLLAWAVDLIYTGSTLVRSGMIETICNVMILNLSYPFDRITILTAVVFMTGEVAENIHHKACCLVDSLVRHYYAGMDGPILPAVCDLGSSRPCFRHDQVSNGLIYFIFIFLDCYVLRHIINVYVFIGKNIYIYVCVRDRERVYVCVIVCECSCKKKSV